MASVVNATKHHVIAVLNVPPKIGSTMTMDGLTKQHERPFQALLWFNT
jgi:hypothetical protein